MTKQKLLELALKRFRLASEAEHKQRERERDDLRFQIPELQWDETARRQRLGNQVQGVPVPPRPILSISQIDQPIQQVLNEERAAHLGINIHPLSPDANDDTAQIIQGIIRQIERDSQAGIARSWAYDRAVKAGMGWYRVNTKYDDAGGHPFDQVVSIDRLLYQDCVKMDPGARKPDFSDAEYAFVTEWVPLAEFKRMYPSADVELGKGLDFAEMTRKEPDWIKGEGEDQAVLVAEYFYKEYEKKKYVALADGRAIPEDEMTEEDELAKDADGKTLPKRVKEECIIKWCKLTAGEVLEEEDWNGHYIPLIPMIGRELQPFEAERRWVGMIGPAKDSQRMVNYAASQAVEIAALEPKAPWIAPEGSFENHESEWQQVNIRNFPYLQYKPLIIGGQPAPPPTRTPIDSARLAISMQLLQEGKNGVQSQMAIYDPSLGQSPDRRDASGKALEALQTQSDASNSHFLHNMADISMAYEAKVILDLIPTIYDRPGRLVRTLDEEDESETVMLNAPHFMHPQTQQPTPAVPIPQNGQAGPRRYMQPPQPGTSLGAPIPPVRLGGPQAPVKHYDLRKGIYGVDVVIGRSWTSKLEQGSEELGQILQASPQLLPILGPLYFKFRDFPGSQEVAELLKEIREKQYPGLGQGDEAPDPQALNAQLQAANQKIQELQQQLQAAGMAIKTDQAKQQASIAKTQMETASREKIAQQESQTQIILARIEALSKQIDVGLAHGHETIQAHEQMAHEAAAQAAQNVHDITAAHAAPMPPAPPAGVPSFTGADSQNMGGEGGL